MFSSAATTGSVMTETMWPTASSIASVISFSSCFFVKAIAPAPSSADRPPVTGINARARPVCPASTPSSATAFHFIPSIAPAARSSASAIVRAADTMSFRCLPLTLVQCSLSASIASP